jgi:predicted RNA binding protein YcfA (HicA-like mRNA interferase family)
MGKRLPVLSCSLRREIVKALSKVGFREIPGRGKGSHVFVYRDAPRTGITIPRENEVKRGTLRSIIRQAGLTIDEFLALL